VRVLENDRLVYYARRANAAYWDEHWAGMPPELVYGPAERGDLGCLEAPFTAFLPKHGPILEAGCGLGQYVLALRARGYDARGIDFAPETIAAIKRRYPDLPVEVGDATAIKVPDGFYGGYISLGVVEHLRGGPDRFLAEALRVLAPGGTAVITVPHFNALRRAKAVLRAYRGPVAADASFYQYAFARGEFAGLIRGAGFEILATGGYDSYKTLKDELPMLRVLLDRQVGRWHLGSALQKILYRFSLAERALGHMMLVVARKPDRS
jgi:SAM-dependent methyltransferase